MEEITFLYSRIKTLWFIRLKQLNALWNRSHNNMEDHSHRYKVNHLKTARNVQQSVVKSKHLNQSSSRSEVSFMSVPEATKNN